MGSVRACRARYVTWVIIAKGGTDGCLGTGSFCLPPLVPIHCFQSSRLLIPPPPSITAQTGACGFSDVDEDVVVMIPSSIWEEYMM